MKGLFLIIILLALLAGAYLTYERIENPKEAGESKDLFDMPNIAKDKMDKFKGKLDDKYEDINSIE